MNKANEVKLRIWPGIAAASVIVVGLGLGIPLNLTMPAVAGAGMLGALIGSLVVVVWWLFFSRVRRAERLCRPTCVSP